MKYLSSIILVLIPSILFTQEEQLLVYTHPTNELFNQQTLPKINDFSERENIQLYKLSSTDGLPNNITSTPALVYRNGQGYSVYSGRYTTFSTIENFIRSARIAPQKNNTLDKRNILIHQVGKMQVGSEIKITPVQFANELAYNNSQFLNSAKKGIENGLNLFQREVLGEFVKTDRIFYLDFHPYYVQQDSLILSVELYSQFSCIDPIYKSVDLKFKGSNTELVFQKAATFLQNEIIQSLKSSTIGDAYHPVSIDNTVKEISELNIPSPKTTITQYASVDRNQPLPKAWQFKSAINPKLPILQFNFQEPLNRYAGEIKSLDGNIALNEKAQLLSGSFEALMQSLTMGEESFDKKVLKEYIKAKSNPKSKFQVLQVINNEPLQWLKSNSLTIKGSMNLLKTSLPITVIVNLLPYIDKDNNEVLLVQANWSMNITDGWNIKGPDGPDPANKTLDFSLNILMEPKY